MEEAVAKHDPDPRRIGLDPSALQASAPGPQSSQRNRVSRRYPNHPLRTCCPFSPLGSFALLVLLLATFLGHAAVSVQASVVNLDVRPANAANAPLSILASDPISIRHDRQVDTARSDGPASLSVESLINLITNAGTSQRANLDLETIDRLVADLRDARAGWTPTASTGQVSLTKRAESASESCSQKQESLSAGQKAAYGILVPVLVILSGLFAGLTLGYMSLDETQLQVLAVQGTPQQKAYAEKIMPIRKDGHLLLTTLLIANMITNETLPIIADPLLGGGVQAVIVSIVLVVIFAELIPQSVCSRYGLAIGAKMAVVTRFVMIVLWPIAYPVSRVLHWTLGPHHGIVYRRGELKELVNMHAATAGRGDLNTDTVTIVGGALDLQEKVVKQAMTPIDKVFMIPLDAKLDYNMLQEIVSSGHSRIPVYHEIEIPVGKNRSGTATPSKSAGFLSTLSRKASTATAVNANDDLDKTSEKSDVAAATPTTGSGKAEPVMTMIKKKKIIGALLVKQCVLLDPEDSVPVKDMVINAVPTVPADEPLLNLLNVFQEGRSHLAIVSSRTQRGSPGSFLSIGNTGADAGKAGVARSATAARIQDLGHIDEEKQLSRSQIKGSRWSRHLRRALHLDEDGEVAPELADGAIDASHVATEMAQRDVPIGIITLEDVLEELIGEEILDEYDSEVEQNFAKLSPPPSPDHKATNDSADAVQQAKADALVLPSPVIRGPTSKTTGGVLQRFKLGRNNSMKDPGSYLDEATKESPVEEAVAAAPAWSETVTLNQASVDADGATAVSESKPRVRAVDVVLAATGEDQPSARSSMASTPTRKESDTAVRSNKPIIIRHQSPGGGASTAIVSESLLRGRGAPVAENQERSRSATPSGQLRGNRFKSSPLIGVGAPTATAPRRQRGMSRDASGSRRGSLLVQQATATSVPSTPITESRDSDSVIDKCEGEVDDEPRQN